MTEDAPEGLSSREPILDLLEQINNKVESLRKITLEIKEKKILQDSFFDKIEKILYNAEVLDSMYLYLPILDQINNINYLNTVLAEIEVLIDEIKNLESSFKLIEDVLSNNNREF